MAGPLRATPEALYGDLSKMEGLGLTANPAEDLPRLKRAPKSGVAVARPTRGPIARAPSGVPPQYSSLARAAAIATRNLMIARAWAAQSTDDPDIMGLLASAEREYARAMYAWKTGTPNYDEATPGLPGVP